MKRKGGATSGLRSLPMGTRIVTLICCALALMIEAGYGRRCMYPICLKHDEYDH